MIVPLLRIGIPGAKLDVDNRGRLRSILPGRTTITRSGAYFVLHKLQVIGLGYRTSPAGSEWIRDRDDVYYEVDAETLAANSD